jgi:hypothetical protein
VVRTLAGSAGLSLGVRVSVVAVLLTEDSLFRAMVDNVVVLFDPSSGVLLSQSLCSTMNMYKVRI